MASDGVMQPSTPEPSAVDIALRVGRNLRMLRDRLHWSLRTLAQRSGVSRAMLGQIELGQSAPTITVLWRIAQALDEPIGRFLENAGDSADR